LSDGEPESFADAMCFASLSSKWRQSHSLRCTVSQLNKGSREKVRHERMMPVNEKNSLIHLYCFDISYCKITFFDIFVIPV
jgi:hypothetical protein